MDAAEGVKLVEEFTEKAKAVLQDMANELIVLHDEVPEVVEAVERMRSDFGLETGVPLEVTEA